MDLNNNIQDENEYMAAYVGGTLNGMQKIMVRKVEHETPQAIRSRDRMSMKKWIFGKRRDVVNDYDKWDYETFLIVDEDNKPIIPLRFYNKNPITLEDGGSISTSNLKVENEILRREKIALENMNEKLKRIVYMGSDKDLVERELMRQADSYAELKKKSTPVGALYSDQQYLTGGKL